MNRRIAPLRKAEDAVVLDTTHMSAREAAEEVVRLARSVRK